MPHQEEESRHLVCVGTVTEELVLVVPPDHPLAARRGGMATVRQVAAEKLIRHGRQKALRGIIDNFFAGLGVQPRDHLEVKNTKAVTEFVARGIGIAIVPKMFAICQPLVRVVPMEKRLFWEIGVLYRKGRTLTAAERRLCALIHEEFLDCLRPEAFR
ncbi:MAG: LysR family transcriptional regulator substrate-binding protein [Planctomycetes bacterium]|nr:LysR family transcriptional regulator substrate-binding protein [Planctomycetota bacterium]